MELDEFTSYVDTHLDVDSEESILALTPQLCELGQNERFLSRFLAEYLDNPESQKDNTYEGHIFILGRGKGFTVRIAGWPAEFEEEPFAHTHTFALLTYGYYGPGYVTDIYTCDSSELKHKKIGEKATLGPRQQLQLTQGKVHYYPAFNVAHIQHVPEEYSISLNLMVHPTNEQNYEQYLVDHKTKTLVGAGGSDRELLALELASWLLPRAEVGHLYEHIAANHKIASVRERAAEILSKQNSIEIQEV